ncbi:DUF4830 domain-containing protein [Paenibacillus lupini]|uniref:DUF4830 domain-containing protein n=1 Tax=Paenibacillus lupini TaxID=1450204 RepID=UPI001FBA91F9|nr:DUF4830 domain-containing protein [Paenibacillus lupini]NIK24643.1 hypothetical protein [Paenibacillus lupini]
MKLKIAALIVILIMLTGCTEDKKEQVVIGNQLHIAYLKDYGWSIDRFGSEIKYAAGTLCDYKEHMDTIRTQGQMDLTPFLNQEVIETGYILKEKTKQYNQIVGYILESHEEIIGGNLEFNNEVEQADGTIRVDSGKITPMKMH